jgi:hypothetical protein
LETSRQDSDGAGGYTSLGESLRQPQAHDDDQHAQAQDGVYATAQDDTYYSEAIDHPPDYLEILPDYSVQKPV